MFDELADRAANSFYQHFGSKNERKPEMSDSVDIEVWQNKEFLSIKNSKRVQTDDPKEIVYEADIIGDIQELEKIVRDDTGKNITLRRRATHV